MSIRHVALSVLFAGALFAAACGGGTPGAGFDNGSSGSSSGTSGASSSGSSGASSSSGFFGDGGASSSSGSTGGPCVGLQCQQHACPGGATTTISGTVYDPALKDPLYNVVVYVPNSAVQPLPSGASCASCDSLYTGDPIATALTDATGKFTLTNAPDGADIPLVIQIGKWRKQLKVPTVTRCQDNPQADKSLSLPKNHTVGDIPSMAIATGGADSMECLLKRIGVDESEYGGGASGAGRIHIFQGAGGAPTAAGAQGSTTLWATKDSLMPYDVTILSCEGSETTGMVQQALFDYAALGGRVFASHFHYSWFNTGPFAAGNLATWTTGGNSIGIVNADIITTFPKGQALKQWLGTVGALNGGQLTIIDAKHNSNVSASNTSSQSWIEASGVSATEYFTFNTPLAVTPDKQCGRVVFSDLHVGAASGDYLIGGKNAPSGCSGGDLSAQEKALEFMLFDLSSCVTPDNKPPQPPPPIGPR
jgi:hypothetical protein